MSSSGVVPVGAPRPPAGRAEQPILLDVTVPRFSGLVARIVVATLGVQDIAQMFEEARVGSVQDEQDHSTFRLALDHGLEVGGSTLMGPVLVGNDDGQVRLTLPRAWAAVARAAKLEPEAAVEPDGTPVCRLWTQARPGAALRVPLPLGARGRYQIEVKVVGADQR